MSVPTGGVFENSVLPVMMFMLSTILSVVILVGLVVQMIPILILIETIRKPRPDQLDDDECPPVAVLLSLRGGDPFLYDCLSRLVEQDYPDYQLIIALDNEKDPAVEFVDRVMDEKKPKNLTKIIIDDRLSSCTLLNNNYAQIIEGLESKIEFVVFVDADAVTWPGWLRGLLRPLVRDNSIGGTSGNRWYAPQQTSLGSLTRAAWNMGSVVQMTLLQLPWGGSMALRADIANHPDMLNRWRTSFAGDTPVYQLIKDCGKKFKINPEIILHNREDTSLRSFYDWMARQLLNVRLYHSAWTPVFAQAIISSVVLSGAILASAVNLIQHNWLELGILGVPLIAYWVAYFVMFLRMDAAIRQGESARGEPSDWLSWRTAHKLFWVTPLAQFVFVLAAIKSLFIRQVCWREIDYNINSAFDIELVKYEPFTNQATGQEHSL